MKVKDLIEKLKGFNSELEVNIICKGIFEDFLASDIIVEEALAYQPTDDLAYMISRLEKPHYPIKKIVCIGRDLWRKV